MNHCSRLIVLLVAAAFVAAQADCYHLTDNSIQENVKDYEDYDIDDRDFQPATASDMLHSERVFEELFDSYKGSPDDEEEENERRMEKLKESVQHIVKLYKAKFGRNKNKNGICTTPACVIAAAALLQNMNQSADPCHDFHEYACGKFSQHTFLSESDTHMLSFQLMEVEIQHIMKSLLEKATSSETSAIGKMKAFYDVCLNTSGMETAGATPLLELLKTVGTFPFQEDAQPSGSYDIDALLKNAHAKTPAGPLVAISVDLDPFNAKKFTLMMQQGGISMETAFYTSSGEHEKKVMAAYKKFMLDTMALLGYKSPAVQTMMADVLEFERKLAGIFLTGSELRQSDKTQSKTRLGQLKSTLSQVDIMQMVSAVLAHSGIKPVSEQYHTVVTGAKTYFPRLNSLLSSTSKTTLANYIGWTVVASTSGFLSKPFRDSVLGLNKLRFGYKASTPQQLTCLAQCVKHFPIAYGMLYTKSKFERATVQKVASIISAVRGEFIRNLDHVQWMDAATKVAAKQKAKAILQLVGYPEKYEDTAKLDKLYANHVVDGLSFFKSQIQLVDATFRASIRKLLEKSVDRAEWSSTPAIVNAFYSSHYNRIVLPAGILRQSFYSQYYPASMNFGGIGTVAGHEITHGFDDHGRKFDKDGNLRPWWSAESVQSFEHNANCIRRQFSGFQLYGEHVNGNRTSGENIADNGGLKMAYRALKRWEDRHGTEARLPGLQHLSSDQMFFLAFGRIWCSVESKGYLIKKIISNAHAPSRFRVAGTMQNNYDFARAYQCPVGSPMNPVDKCIIW